MIWAGSNSLKFPVQVRQMDFVLQHDFTREPHVEFARQQTRTQPPPRGFAIAKQRSGFTKSTKFRAGGMFVSFCDPTGNRTPI